MTTRLCERATLMSVIRNTLKSAWSAKSASMSGSVFTMHGDGETGFDGSGFGGGIGGGIFILGAPREGSGGTTLRGGGAGRFARDGRGGTTFKRAGLGSIGSIAGGIIPSFLSLDSSCAGVRIDCSSGLRGAFLARHGRHRRWGYSIGKTKLQSTAAHILKLGSCRG